MVGDSTPVGALLDLHGNVSEDMVASGAILVACKEYPHIDYPQRAEELYALLARGARDGLRTRTVMRRVPMVAILGTTEEPMRGFVRKMQARERDPGILSISAMHGFPWSDTPYTSAAMLVVHDADDARAATDAGRIARELAAEFFEHEDDRARARLPIDEALDVALRESERLGNRPVVIADGSDNPGRRRCLRQHVHPARAARSRDLRRGAGNDLGPARRSRSPPPRAWAAKCSCASAARTAPCPASRSRRR